MVEIIGATTTLVYGLNHLFYTTDGDRPGRKQLAGPIATGMHYHIRCMVPCYKESLQILQVCCILNPKPLTEPFRGRAHHLSQAVKHCLSMLVVLVKTAC